MCAFRAPTQAVQKYAELQLSLGVTEDVENTVDVENTGHVENTEDDNAGETKMFGHLTGSCVLEDVK